MKKILDTMRIERFLEGDLRLEGSCATFQGQVAFLSRIDSEPNSLKVLLSPLAEKTGDGRRWRHAHKEQCEFKLTVELVKEESKHSVIFQTTENEKITFFIKGHPEQLNFESLKDHDIEIGSN